MTPSKYLFLPVKDGDGSEIVQGKPRVYKSAFGGSEKSKKPSIQ
jgi:hypothetical protein